ncbi:hypothetical protein OG429_02825 [Streptomyces sp. NBC_00190]|uniref:hypothetical protein n=1 Tax=unclassified Streptomyces TaxID=2593676 RepID=UPI002E2B8092|nr:hypothetical protein [Streptomyces sp. NBC_00190]WSZ38349.1 hypothetical protein OG239_05835 [Streptomyces sp. NBC_00868]
MSIPPFAGRGPYPSGDLHPAQAAPATARQGADSLAGPLALDNLLSLKFLAPTVRDAKRQVGGLVSGLSPAPASASGLGRLLK